MTKESLLKKQGWISVKRRGQSERRPRSPLSLFLSTLLSAGCLAGEMPAREYPSHEHPSHEHPANGDASRTVRGDLIRIPLGQQAGAPTIGTLPRMGTHREAVLRQLGEPRKRQPAVGEPPISSWEYADVVVYFEHDHVIHAVRKHVPIVSTP